MTNTYQISQGLNSVHAGMNSLRANVTLSAAVMNNLRIGHQLW